MSRRFIAFALLALSCGACSQKYSVGLADPTLANELTSVLSTPSPSSSPGPTASITSTTPTAGITSPPPASHPTVTCTAATTTENLRIMFMMDNSGSTATTDPSHTYRVKTVQTFIQNYGSHTNLTYSFGYFSGTTAQEYDSTKSAFEITPTTAFGNSDFLTAALTAYENIKPDGHTPYSAAFTSLQTLAEKDVAAGSKENYVVVFMSDGMPTDISGNVASGIITLVDQLRTTVQSNGKSLLTVSSVYFGPESDAVSIGNLTTMASEGQGQFVDTNQLTSALSINDVITVPGSCQ
jgi:hypothetical protein